MHKTKNKRLDKGVIGTANIPFGIILRKIKSYQGYPFNILQFIPVPYQYTIGIGIKEIICYLWNPLSTQSVYNGINFVLESQNSLND